MNFENAVSRCSIEELKPQMQRMQNYSQYIILCETTSADYLELRNMFDFLPKQVREFYKLINGGYLFDTQILSTKPIDRKNGMRLQRLSIYNSDTARKMSGLPEKYIAFAIASFGDLYCFSADGSENIIQWSSVSHKEVGRWKNISSWLKEEMDIAIELVREGSFAPMGVHQE